MLDEEVGHEHLGRVGLDPAHRHRRRLVLQIADGGEVDAAVGVERPARLGLEPNAGRVDPGGGEPVAQARRDGRRDVLDGRGGVAGAGGVARRREASADVDLGRAPAVQLGGQPADRRREAPRHRAPHLGVCAVAAEVGHDSG